MILNRRIITVKDMKESENKKKKEKRKQHKGDRKKGSYIIVEAKGDKK